MSKIKAIEICIAYIVKNKSLYMRAVSYAYFSTDTAAYIVA